MTQLSPDRPEVNFKRSVHSQVYPLSPSEELQLFFREHPCG